MTADLTIMDVLKAATADAHRNAEQRQLQRDLVRGALAPALYGAWLGQMLLIHEALWRELVARAGATPALARVVRDEGRHVHNLRADLAALGHRAGGVEALPSTRRLQLLIAEAGASNPTALLGFNYVLEGSMNGNRFIAKAVGRSIQPPAVAYLDPYGEEQRPSWQAYRERMNAEAFEPAQAEAIVAAAEAMFSGIGELSDELLGDSIAA